MGRGIWEDFHRPRPGSTVVTRRAFSARVIPGVVGAFPGGHRVSSSCRALLPGLGQGSQQTCFLGSLEWVVPSLQAPRSLEWKEVSSPSPPEAGSLPHIRTVCTHSHPLQIGTLTNTGSHRQTHLPTYLCTQRQASLHTHSPPHTFIPTHPRNRLSPVHTYHLPHTHAKTGSLPQTSHLHTGSLPHIVTTHTHIHPLHTTTGLLPHTLTTHTRSPPTHRLTPPRHV